MYPVHAEFIGYDRTFCLAGKTTIGSGLRLGRYVEELELLLAGTKPETLHQRSP